MTASALRVSVALCTYNGGRYVAEQLASILGQTATPAEVIVSDDGSVDDTVRIVSGLLSDGPSRVPFRLLQNERPLGVVRNFEQAIAATTGDLIALSDQDDVWESDKLAVLVRLFDEDPKLLFVHTDARLIDDAGAAIGPTVFEALEITKADIAAIHDGDAFGAYLRRNLATGATVVFRRELLSAARPFAEEWVHDEWLAILAAALSGADVVEESLVRYRRHDANQIGVADSSLRTKIRRVLEPSPGRNEVLARRFAVLADRLVDLGASVPSERLSRAQAKAQFERSRADMPRLRIARIPAIVRLALRGDYEAFASRGKADILRDALQPR